MPNPITKTNSITMTALDGVPLVAPGDDIFEILKTSLAESHLALDNGDVIVIAQKIISKAENRYVTIDQVTPSSAAIELAQKTEKDPRIVEVILSESAEVVKHRPGLIIVQHKLGFVHANAGIDQSNLPSEPGEKLLLLPKDPDASALALKSQIADQLNIECSVVINDSFGRAWRNGSAGIAIGSAGFTPLQDLVGKQDLFGRTLEITTVAIADEIAAGASLLMGQAGEGTPIVIIKGLNLPKSNNDDDADGNINTNENVSVLIRPKESDLFR